MEIRFFSPDLIDLRNKLYSFAARGVPHAARNALNRSAFRAREQWQREIFFSLTLRNRWTERSIQVNRAGGLNIAAMEAKVGSTADYMRTQEEGGVERKKHKVGVPIPTPISSGERGNPRRRLVRPMHRLPNIQLRPRIGATQKQRNAIAIEGARRAGKKHVFLELERKKGIFRLSGGKRRTKIELVHDLSRTSVRIPATHTLQDALRNVQRHLPDIAVRAMVEQLERYRVVGFR